MKTTINNYPGTFKLIQMLINDGIKRVAIISTPTYTGGRKETMIFSKDPLDYFEDYLEDFTYIEWEGRPIDLLKTNPILCEVTSVFHEEPHEYVWPWWEEIKYMYK